MEAGHGFKPLFYGPAGMLPGADDDSGLKAGLASSGCGSCTILSAFMADPDYSPIKQLRIKRAASRMVIGDREM